MKTALLAVVVALIVGCAAPLRTIKFESDPPGGRVFMQSGGPGFVASAGRNFLGTTPCTWTTVVGDDGAFEVESGKIPLYSKFVQALVVFTCEPPSSQTNLYTRKETFRCNAKFQPGTAIPDGIFFDLTKPSP